MALLAEQLVDEWLNRNGFFTLRGIKKGVEEIDLLGIRERQSRIEGWHVEVQVSFRPVSYIGKLSRAEQERHGAKSANSAKRRPPQLIAETIQAWVQKKFKSPKKQQMRDQCWPGIKWDYKLIHAKVFDPSELSFIEKHEVKTIPLHKILVDLYSHKPGELFGAAGTDIAELIRYFADNLERKIDLFPQKP
jgi:hypothetical protein